MISTKQFTVFEVTDKIKYSKQKRNIYDYRMELVCFNTTEDLFAENETKNKEVTIADIFKMVEDGKAFFPVNKTPASDVEKLERIGLTPVFMRAGDFIKMRKAYKEYMGGQINA